MGVHPALELIDFFPVFPQKIFVLFFILVEILNLGRMVFNFKFVGTRKAERAGIKV